MSSPPATPTSLRLAIVLFAAFPAFAQSTAEVILLPTLFEPAQGEQKAEWRAEFVAINTSEQFVRISHPQNCPTLCPGMSFLGPGNATSLPSLVRPDIQAPGVLLRGDRAELAQVTFSLRVRDVSRNAADWGTDVPVPRLGSLRPGPVELLQVPAGSAYRTLLRVYDLSDSDDSIVSLRFYDSSNRLLLERSLPLHTESHEDFPSYGVLSHLEAIPELANQEVVRVQVRGAPAQRLWAFISVTNNVTQHITLITPN